ncbi:MAG: GNAT family N-acetyltransferase [Candidatus Binatia bacterium]
MNSEYEIVKYTPELRSQVLELQTHLWNPDVAVNAAYLEWKYERNLHPQASYIPLALHRGRVVGMWGLYSVQWQSGYPCHTWLGLGSGDMVIAPAHRGQGLFTQMVHAALRDLADQHYPYMFSLSASPVTHPMGVAIGWRSLGPLPMMQRKGNRLSPASPFRLLDRYRVRRRQAQVSLEYRPRPQAMAEVVECIGHDGRIRQVRDQRYFAWRFHNPLSSYRFLFWQDTRVEGYLVLQAKRYKDQAQVNIVDWEATNAQVRADLLRAAVRWGNCAALSIWAATFSQEVQTLLQESGFRPVAEAPGITHSRPTLLVRAVRDEIPESEWHLAGRRVLHLADWDLRMLDSDSY